MATRNPKDLFLMPLSDARRNTERSAATYREISEMAENPGVKEALEVRALSQITTSKHWMSALK